MLQSWARRDRELNFVNVSTALHRLAWEREVPPSLYSYLADQCTRHARVTPAERMSPVTVGGILYGLHRAPKTPSTALILRVVGERMEEEACVTPVQLAFALFGLKGVGSIPAARRVVVGLTRWAESFKSPLGSEHVGAITHGLHNIAGYPEGRRLIRLVGDLIQRYGRPLGPSGVASSLMGFKAVKSPSC
eukprot:Hpha_TRINITY_DN4852_c0_g1::TRINITY_DN4852_c0_g1_i2::g.20354::m.20354